MSGPQLVAICVGQPTTYGSDDAINPMDRTWTTSFYKYPIEGPRWLGTLNVEGDGQADRVNHGGADKAVLAYSADHYQQWNQDLPDVHLGYGAFAENFDILGLSEATVCIGDVYAVGDAVVQVSQPRIPCWKIARRWRVADLTLRVQQSRRTGWYLRVLQEAEIDAGLEVRLVDREYPAWTVERCNYLLHVDKENRPLARELSELPPLAESWRRTLRNRATE